MSKRLLTLFILVMPLVMTQSFAQTETGQKPSLNIELLQVGRELQFQQPARLENALKLATDQGASLQYPLGTTLFDKSDSATKASTALKNAVLKQMAQRNLVAHPFYHFIQKQRFAPRALSALDIDNVRLNKFDNPLLRGNYALATPLREEKIQYLGNLSQIHSVKSHVGLSLSKQLTHVKSEAGEALTSPVLIYPDGQVVKPHQGTWLTTQYYLPPLTMVYIPFEELESSEMDQDIVRLLTQLVPTSTKKPQ